MDFPADKRGLGGVLDFAILFLLGGVLWLLGICSLTGASFLELMEDGNFRYFKSVGYIIGGFLIAKSFGLV